MPYRNAPDARSVTQKAATNRIVPASLAPAGARTIGQANAAKQFNAATVRPSADAAAATFAATNARTRTGRGESASTSRRSGNAESQFTSANTPTVNIVSEIRKRS